MLICVLQRIRVKEYSISYISNFTMFQRKRSCLTILTCFVFLTCSLAQNTTATTEQALTKHGWRDSFGLNCGGKPIWTAGWNAESDLDHHRPSWIELFGATRYSDDAPRSKFDYSNNWRETLATERYSANPHSFGYKIRHLDSVYWNCNLWFAETNWYSEGDRVFRAIINGKGAYVDVLAETRRFKRYKVRISSIYVSRTMTINFKRIHNDPMVSGIWCWKR